MPVRILCREFCCKDSEVCEECSKGGDCYKDHQCEDCKVWDTRFKKYLHIAEDNARKINMKLDEKKIEQAFFDFMGKKREPGWIMEIS
jgi:hypothetical protein